MPFRRLHRDRRAAVALMVGIMLTPLMLALSVAIDFARIADVRARLQSAVDQAALSGAAAYSVNASAAQSRAIVMATAAFCDTAGTLPGSATLASVGATPCASGSSAGPVVSTQVAGYKAGTLGITPSACSATNPVVAGVRCGFVVTVTAQAKIASFVPNLLGSANTLTVTAIAANPFINIANTITAQINGSARYTDSIWLYPVLLDSNGNVDFTTNAGAIPGLVSGVYPADAAPSGCTSLVSCGSIGTSAGINCTSTPSACGTTPPSGCTSSPAQFTCGAYVMLASTYYNTATNPCLPTAPCYPNGAGTYPMIVQGVVQNPASPNVIITATTPIAFAYMASSGANDGYAAGGYQANPANGCVYPGNTIYTTVSQYFSNATDTIVGGSPAMDWPKITHWFYSSYLMNGLAPSQGEIYSQSNLLSYTPNGGSTVNYNTRIPSIGSNASGSFSPSLASCAALNSKGNSYDEFLTTTFPSTGSTNGSLFILNQPAGSAYIPPASTGLAGVYYTPAKTPGAQYGAISCQAFGSNVFTYYWNDMGGNAAFWDDLDYGNGTLRVSCVGNSFVLLIG